MAGSFFSPVDEWRGSSLARACMCLHTIALRAMDDDIGIESRF